MHNNTIIYQHVLTTGVEMNRNTSQPPMTGLETSYLWSSSQAAVGSLPHAAVSAFCDNRFKLGDNILERKLLKHIRSKHSHYISSLNHFSNWSNKTLTSHSWTWAGEFDIITNLEEALSIESGHFSHQTANPSSLTGSSLVRIQNNFW